MPNVSEHARASRIGAQITILQLADRQTDTHTLFTLSHIDELHMIPCQQPSKTTPSVRDSRESIATRLARTVSHGVVVHVLCSTLNSDDLPRRAVLRGWMAVAYVEMICTYRRLCTSRWGLMESSHTRHCYVQTATLQNSLTNHKITHSSVCVCECVLQQQTTNMRC